MKRKIFISLALASLLVGCKKDSPTEIDTSNQNISSEWVRTNGPYSGRITAFAVTSNDTGGTNLFVGTRGGVFLTTNNGTSWTPSGLTDTSVYSFASSGANLFAGTADSGIILSTNMGASWAQMAVIYLSQPIRVAAVYALAFSDTDLIAGTDVGVVLLTPTIANWKIVTTNFNYLPVVAVAVSGTNVFAGAFNGPVNISTNDGVSWAPAGSINPSLQTLFVSGKDLLAGTLTNQRSGTVLITHNNGATWTAADSGLTNTSVYSFAISGSNLFAGTANGVFLSTNNGTSWNAASSGMNATHVYGLIVSGAYLFAGTESGVWRRPL